MTIPRFMKEEMDGRAARNRKPRKHEKLTAECLGGQTQPGSGAKEGFKGDVRGVGTPFVDFLVECKRTEGFSIRILVKWLNKITTEAGIDKEPALAIQFEPTVLKMATEHGQITAESEWIAVPQSVFTRMLNALNESKE